MTAKESSAGEEADFPLNELSDRDLENIKLGSVFRWVIGYEKKASGTKKRYSEIVFREMPQWTNREIQSAEKKASEIVRSINWE